MLRRHSMVIAAAAVSCLALLPVTSAQAAVRAPWATPRPGSTYSLAFRFQRPAGESESSPRPHPRRVRGRLRAEARARPAPGPGPRRSTACPPSRSSVPRSPPGSGQVTQASHGPPTWPACCTGTPSYTGTRVRATCAPASARMGPVAAEIARLDLRALAPALVIVQAGHDDIGVPLRLEQRRVEQAVALIHAEAPHARIALLTVFTGRSARRRTLALGRRLPDRPCDRDGRPGRGPQRDHHRSAGGGMDVPALA